MDENCSILDTKLDRWEEIINENLTASYNAARAFWPKLRKGSAIVMTNFWFRAFARPGCGAYSISNILKNNTPKNEEDLLYSHFAFGP